jgi:L-alanine-DL-glutamate epimerase-like enolase superfamily enzyme
VRHQAEKIIADVARLGRVDDARDLIVTKMRFVPLSHQFLDGCEQRWSGGVLPGVTAGVVEVMTSDGIVGYGETYAGTFAPAVVGALVEHFAPMVIGSPAGEISETWNRCYTRSLYWGRSGVAVSVLSAIESALWDVCGKAVGRPVHELLGSSNKADIACYASGGMDTTPDALTREQRGYVEVGFGGTKIRGGHDPNTDAEKVGLARDAVGPAFPLAMDAVQGSNPRPWTADEAIATGRAVSEHSLLWLEEPCGALDIEGHSQCRRQLEIRIAGGETLTTALEFLPFFEAGAFDIAQPDASHTGGLLEALKVARLAEHYSVRTAMHVWGSGMCVMANVHVAFAADSCDWLEYPTIPNPLISLLQSAPTSPENGRYPRPPGPGLGVHLPDGAESDFAYMPGNHYRFQDRH